MLKKVKSTQEKYKSYIMPAAIIVGFLFDTITLNRIDQVFDNAILVTHLLIVSIGIILLFGKNSKLAKKLKVEERENIINTIIIFSFGALFSGFIIFYTRSGSLSSSWPFILTLVALMLGTELKKTYYQNIILQISFLYLALFSYLIFFLPVVFASLGVRMFIVSGVTSLGIMFLFTRLLKKINLTSYKEFFLKIRKRILIIFIVFNILYFTNIIPPVPLSLKFKAVYHSIEVIGENIYEGTYEETSRYNIFRKRSRVIHRNLGEPAYVFASVFAPTRIRTSIYHSWQYYDSDRVQWIKTDRIQIPISGGREDGFRGFSMKENLMPGKWRVVIETERGQKLGQIRFKIKDNNKTYQLETEQL